MIILAFAENAIQLIPDGTLLSHLALVLFMVAILNRTLFKPINKVLAEREAQTAGRGGEARKTREEINENLSRYEQTLREARTSAYREIETQRAEALRKREQQVTQVREEIRNLMSKEKAEIERQVEDARRTLRQEAIQTAEDIGSQLLQRRVS